MAKSETKTDKQISRLKNSRWIAPLIVIAIIVIGIVQFGVSIQTMAGWAAAVWPIADTPDEESEPDAAKRSMQERLVKAPKGREVELSVADAKQHEWFKELEREVPAEARDHLILREQTAAEVLQNLGDMDSLDFEEVFSDLYLGRSTRWPGWRAKVQRLPSRIFDEGWFCCFEELGSGTVIMASTGQDLSNLRDGDLAILNGKIQKVELSMGGFAKGSVTLEDAKVFFKPSP